MSLALAAGAEDDLVAVLEEAPGLAGGQLHRLLAASGDLQQRAELAGLGAGQGAGAEQVAGLQLAAIDAVVGDHLRHRPVHAQAVAQGQALRRQAFLAQALGEQQDLQLDVEGAVGLVVVVVEIRQRPRVAFGARWLGTAERLQGFGGDHPGRDAGNEALRQERAERLVFPGLDVARRPVVEQAEAGDVLGGAGNRDGFAEGVALADPDAQLQFVVQARAGAEHRLAGAGRQGLAVGPAHFAAGDAHGRGAAVVADGHVLVVGQQWVVRAEQLADVLGMADADVEVGVVADPGR